MASSLRITSRRLPCMASKRIAARTLATAVPAEASLHRPSKDGKPPTAVVLLNMGGPSTVSEVNSFLTNLFSDKDLIPLPFQSFMAPWIARRRTPKIEQQYADIGGGSPILKYTKEQGRLMCQLLDELSPETAPHKPYVAFRYANPMTSQTMAELKADGVKRAIAFTQYPQYSCSTTGSSLNELYRKGRLGEAGKIKWSVIDRWATHDGLVDAFTNLIYKALLKFPVERRSKVVLLFSAHSLPMSVVNRGDPYVMEVATTVGSVIKRLASVDGFRNPYRLVWQSQVGPSAWMGQQTIDALKGLARLGPIEEKRTEKAGKFTNVYAVETLIICIAATHKLSELVSVGYTDVILVPIAFTSDHIETLYELDLEYVKEGKELGLNVQRAESLNVSPTFIRAMADLVHEHLKDTAAEGGQPVSTQMMLRCPGCTNETCGDQKRWFAGWGR